MPSGLGFRAALFAAALVAVAVVAVLALLRRREAADRGDASSAAGTFEPSEPPPPEPERPPLVGAPPPREPPRVEADPPPVAMPPLARETARREWNLWELEQASRKASGGDPLRDEERNYLLVYLREFANAEGTLPADFDSLVRDSFADVIPAR
jgi:hypothetical protein